MRELEQIDVGFAPVGLATIRVDVPPGAASADDGIDQFYNRIADGLSELPFVVSVSSVGPAGISSPFRIEGQTEQDAGRNPLVSFEAVSPNYFSTMEARMVEGRPFTIRDRAGSTSVVIVNERFARSSWPGESPLGARISASGNWLTVVGVVAGLRDVQYRDLTAEPPAMYLPIGQSDLAPAGLMLRTHLSGEIPSDSIRRRLLDLNPGGISVVRWMSEQITDQMLAWRANLLLFASFAGLTVFLAGVGLHTLIAGTILEQSKELAVRLALGATPGGIVRGVLASAGRVLVAGAAAGIVLAVGVTRFVSTLLYGVDPLDPLTLVATPLALLILGLAAATWPAARAASIDPASTLRSE